MKRKVLLGLLVFVFTFSSIHSSYSTENISPSVKYTSGNNKSNFKPLLGGNEMTSDVN